MAAGPAEQVALRAIVRGRVQAVGFREATRREGRRLGVMGWVRNTEDGSVAVHAEGPEAAVDELTAFLREGPPAARIAGVEVEPAKVEGHEQFAIRGVRAGDFVVEEHAVPSHHFDLRLEVAGERRSWTLPKGPSMDPAVKRLALEAPDSSPADDSDGGKSSAVVWDRGGYEQGGRVAWPQALERGHAVFVLHGERLRGGFALQRTRSGDRPRWLLIKRRDEDARPGSDVLAEKPR